MNEVTITISDFLTGLSSSPAFAVTTVLTLGVILVNG